MLFFFVFRNSVQINSSFWCIHVMPEIRLCTIRFCKYSSDPLMVYKYSLVTIQYLCAIFSRNKHIVLCHIRQLENASVSAFCINSHNYSLLLTSIIIY